MSAEPDYLAQLVEAASAEIKEPLWRSDHNARSDAELRELARAALTAALTCDLTQPCAACEPHDPGAFLGVCPDCQGSGRVSSGARLAIVKEAKRWQEWSAVPVYRDITKGEQ